MSDSAKGSPIKRMFKKAEHQMDKPVDHPDSESDQGYKCHLHHHPYQQHNEDEKKHITINVKVEGCCLCDSTAGAATGTTSSGCPIHQTENDSHES